MGCHNRMKLAIDALSIFVQSLPVDCRFSIISFGSRFDALFDDAIEDEIHPEIMLYNDKNKDSALTQIATFGSNYGGTDILTPLRYAHHELISTLKKRIFLLTDGSVGSPESVI